MDLNDYQIAMKIAQSLTGRWYLTPRGTVRCDEQCGFIVVRDGEVEIIGYLPEWTVREVNQLLEF